MKHITALHPPPCVKLDLPKAPPFVTASGDTLDEIERDLIFESIAISNALRREKRERMRRRKK